MCWLFVPEHNCVPSWQGNNKGLQSKMVLFWFKVRVKHFFSSFHHFQLRKSSMDSWDQWFGVDELEGKLAYQSKSPLTESIKWFTGFPLPCILRRTFARMSSDCKSGCNGQHIAWEGIKAYEALQTLCSVMAHKSPWEKNGLWENFILTISWHFSRSFV